MLITHDLGVVAGIAQRTAVMYAGRIVETGVTSDVFDQPAHPYTVGLLHSIPRLDRDDEDLLPIEGRPPDMRQMPTGCAFAPRCAWRIARCLTEVPPLAPAAPTSTIVTTGAAATHMRACHNPPTAAEAATGAPIGRGATLQEPPA
jgi:oligopeptide/dipeptide ABC transporter ATP-binding protein